MAEKEEKPKTVKEIFDLPKKGKRGRTIKPDGEIDVKEAPNFGEFAVRELTKERIAGASDQMNKLGKKLVFGKFFDLGNLLDPKELMPATKDKICHEREIIEEIAGLAKKNGLKISDNVAKIAAFHGCLEPSDAPIKIDPSNKPQKSR